MAQTISQFANNIKVRRNEKGLTQDELAKIISVSRTSISNWETGKNYPDFELLIAISNALDISLDVLIKEDYELMEHVAKNEKLGKKRKLLLKIIVPITIILLVVSIYSFSDMNVSKVAKEDIVSYSIDNSILTVEVKLGKYESLEGGEIHLDGDNDDKLDFTVYKERSIRNYYKDDKETTLKIVLDEVDLKSNEMLFVNTGEMLEF